MVSIGVRPPTPQCRQGEREAGEMILLCNWPNQAASRWRSLSIPQNWCSRMSPTGRETPRLVQIYVIRSRYDGLNGFSQGIQFIPTESMGTEGHQVAGHSTEASAAGTPLAFGTPLFCANILAGITPSPPLSVCPNRGRGFRFCHSG